MKNLFIIIIDSILIIGGLILTGFSFMAWQNTGFQIEGWNANSLFEGRMTFWSMVGGLAIMAYALFDILIFRRAKHVLREGEGEIPKLSS